MFTVVDDFLNRITMYRLVLYVLIFLIANATILAFFKLLPFDPLSLLTSTIFLTFVCWVTNRVFAYVFEGPTNFESVYITALILALILTPMVYVKEVAFLGWAAVLAISSKYILAISKKHIFNPVALSVVMTSIFLGHAASWWIGTFPMLPAVLVGGLLIVRKTRRVDMVLAFLASAVLVILSTTILKNSDIVKTFRELIFATPILFFAFIMLTEPLTTPPLVNLQIIYGVIVGFLFATQIHVGNFYTTPEIALIAGNVFSYFVSPKGKLVLTLKQKAQIGNGIYDFQFATDKKINYSAGQYLEWTLGHNHIDSRGNRRYFTIASSPTEQDIRLGVRFYEKPSSFKKSLAFLNPGDKIVAGQLAGEFTLPKDKNKKLVFIAGGIGVTPYRSMIKSLLDNHESRQITLIYSNNTRDEIVYRDLFEKARQELGIKTVYTLTAVDKIPQGWMGRTGFVNEQMIKEEVPDFNERYFYISGSHTMVKLFEDMLKKMGVAENHIKVDFFPGLA